MPVRVIQNGFSGGEIGPQLFGRADLEKYALSLKTAKNCIITKYGGIKNRPGTQYIGEVRNSGKTTRIVGFQFSTTQAYVLEWGETVMQPIYDGGQVLESAKNVASITQANPGVVTITSHGYSNGDKVYPASLGGMVELLDNRVFRVENVTTHTFTLADIWGNAVNTTNYTAYTSGGTFSRLYQLSFPYDDSEVFDVSYDQTADTMLLAHPSYAPRALTRTGHASWSVSTITFAASQAAPTSESATATVGSGATTYSYKITAIDEDGGEESLPTSAASCTNDLTIAGNYNTVTWTGASGAERYIVYKNDNGVYGLIGGTTGTSFIDDNILPDLGDTPPSARNPFGSSNNYPAIVSFHEGRSVWAQTNNTPAGVWMSVSNRYYNMNVAVPAKSDDAVTFELRPGVNAVQGLASMRKLVVLTSDAEYTAEGGGVTKYITPASLVVERHTARGSKRLKPIVIGDIVLHVQRQGSVVRALGYSFEKDGFRSNDLTLLAPHLFAGHTIVDWCYQQDPDSIVWCARDDGVLLALTFVEDQNTFAWSKHYLGGNLNHLGFPLGYGFVDSIACIEGAVQDDVYLVVRRTINGVSKRYIEKLVKRWDGDAENIAAAKFLDSHIVYTSASAASTIPNLWHLEGQSVMALVDGNVQGPFTVTNGAITLDQAMAGTSANADSQAVVGLGYTADIEDLPVVQPTQNGARLGREVNSNHLALKVHKSRGLQVAQVGQSGKIVSFKARGDGEVWNDPIAPYSGDIKTTLDGGWDLDGNVLVRQEYPLPLEVLSIAKDVTIGGP